MKFFVSTVSPDVASGAKARSGSIAYRADIDGLRAIAVLSVVWYHFAPSGLRGGFVGVDIFFVISGYLITGILAKSFETRTYSVLDFYQRRIRRIFPALLLVLAFSLAVGWFLLFPSEFGALGKHVAAGAGFVQNFVLWGEAGYFDEAAVRKPLLHLWSLAVEEQFYIFWPLLMWLVMRLRLPMLTAIAVIVLASFGLNIWGLQRDPTAVFYLPVMRAWELMAGAWLAVAHRQRLTWLTRGAEWQSWLGLILILVGISVIRPEYDFPGFWGLLPVLGSALLINAGMQATFNRTVLASRVAVWIGLISYPLYLWHWSLWSLTHVVFGPDQVHLARDWVRPLLLALSILLSWLTYRWLELPIRRGSRVWTTAGLAGAVTAAGVAGLIVFQQGGVPDRAAAPPGADRYLASIIFSPKVTQCHDLNKGSNYGDKWYCELGDIQAERWLMAYGDSHAMSMIPALDQYGLDKNFRVVFASRSACPALLNLITLKSDEGSVGRGSEACVNLVRLVVDKVEADKPQAVVLVGRWPYYARVSMHEEGHYVLRRVEPGKNGAEAIIEDNENPFRAAMVDTFKHFQAVGMPVVVLKDNPVQAHDLPWATLRFHARGADLNAKLNEDAVTFKQHLGEGKDGNEMLDEVAANYPHVSLLNIDSALCNQRVCPWAMDGEFLYRDAHHLTPAGAMKVYPLLAAELDRVLNLEAQ